jgi:phage tail protein X
MATYIKIASNTVGAGGVASVTFSSIPATYTDLIIKASVRTNAGGTYDQLNWSFNGTTTGYTNRILQGDGAGAASYNAATRELGIVNGNTATASTFSNTELYLPNYTSTNNKSYSIDTVTENNATTAYMQLDAGGSTLTSAINSIAITAGSNFLQYTTFTLYGISNA